MIDRSAPMDLPSLTLEQSLAARPLTTTLARIRAHSPCTDGWRKLLTGLGKTEPDDEPLPFATILSINGVDDALWCLRAEPRHERLWRLMAVRMARTVEHLMTDERSRTALAVAERHAFGAATDGELAAAWDAARAAAWDAARDAAWEAARDAQKPIFLALVGGGDD